MVTGVAVSVAPFTTETSTATCPAGSLLLRGGYSVTPTNVQIVDAYGDYPSIPGVGGTWRVTIGSDGSLTFTPYAICSP